MMWQNGIMAVLTLYARAYCHLCEELAQALFRLRDRYGFELRVIDIEKDPALEARYGGHVPVLCAEDGDELCHYALDEARVRAYLERCR